MTFSMNVIPRFRAYLPIDKTKPERVLRVWTEEEKRKLMTFEARGFSISEIKDKMGEEFTWMMVRKKIQYLKNTGYECACPTCGQAQ